MRRHAQLFTWELGSRAHTSSLHISPAFNFHCQSFDLFIFPRIYAIPLTINLVITHKLFFVPYHFLKSPILLGSHGFSILPVSPYGGRGGQSPSCSTSDCEASKGLCSQVLFQMLLRGPCEQERKSQASAGRRLRSTDVTFPQNHPVFISPVIIHYFVYKWEIAF